jgi:predicted metal-dependent enzyme (double-stranded beta helix superfamily)
MQFLQQSLLSNFLVVSIDINTKFHHSYSGCNYPLVKLKIFQYVLIIDITNPLNKPDYFYRFMCCLRTMVLVFRSSVTKGELTMSKLLIQNHIKTRREFLTSTAKVASALVLPSTLLSASTRSKTPIIGSSMDLERFVEDCVKANNESDAQLAVQAVLKRAVSSPKKVLAALGDPIKAGINVLHRSTTLTIFSATWTPQMNLMPHNHLMWANIGIYTGREDNIMWKNTNDGIKAFGADALFAKGTATLPADVIHSVTNPLLRFTGGIHIYGGDFFATERSQWDPETLDEEPSDGEAIRSIFNKENKRLGLEQKG